MIQERLRQGVYVKDIAAELGVHPRTVSRARTRGDAPHGVDNDGRPGQLQELLGRFRAHARSETSSRKNGGNTAHDGLQQMVLRHCAV